MQLHQERQASDKRLPEQAREEIERRLHSSEQRSHELEVALAAERQANEETERRLYSSEQRSSELEVALAAQRKAKRETERRFYSSEQRSRELEASLAAERQSREETERRLHSSEQRSRVLRRRLHDSEQRSSELEASLATEKQEKEETERRFYSSEQRSHELETSLAAERQSREETERRLYSSEQRSSELETTLATVQQEFEESLRSNEPSCDWILDRNEIRLSDKEIGVGAWGRVVEGTFGGYEVAVKEMHQAILSPYNKRLFEREMNIASKCRHPCLLQFIGATNDDQSPLFVTELLETNLRAVLRKRPLEPSELMTIALDVAKGLNYLHLKRPAPIVHRDISSANVLLWKKGANWRAKVSDYGTANFLQTIMTACPGAVIYSAPEAHTPQQSPKVDGYSFGVLLCEMNIREMPDVNKRKQQIARVSNTFYRRLIRRCLLQNFEERSSMAEIIEEIKNSE
ncbi:probable serine/threonine-protein kinase DDB_G0271682 [Actinia tenebrosa]|uniref:Probable serine/threonine-protein kinase DDB_G0271682 n=1 Tax=Actinia tenebrosa TaxID=6105 RepID=A0A6P8J035_ACTTE|nr:probable serine/threonine-protein kinase DDB_G0271682 [Actinia tenebrosa]